MPHWPGWERDLGLVGAYTEIIRKAFSQAAREEDTLRAQAGRGVIAVTAVQLRDMLSDVLEEAVEKALHPLAREAWQLGWDSARQLVSRSAEQQGEADGYVATEVRHWAQQIARTGLKDAARRAELIARTEVARAQSAAALTCYRHAGIAYKQLAVAPDERACAECRADAAEGIIPLDAAFRSGNTGAPVHPACRCIPVPAGVTVEPPLAHLGKGKKKDLVAFLLIRARNADGKWRYLLQKRSEDSKHGGTWGLPGGTAHPGESPWDAALRESEEEMGQLPGVKPDKVLYRDDGKRDVYTFVVDLKDMFQPGIDGATPGEVDGWGWFRPREIGELELHPGFEELWDAYRDEGLEKGRKRVALNGQQMMPAAGGGAPVPHPHRRDDTRVAPGGRPGTEPPRWDGDETEPYVVMPGGPAGAAGVREGRAGTPPAGGTGGYRDGTDTTGRPRETEDEPDDADDAWWPLTRGRPPNAVGKGAVDRWDPNPVPAEHVMNQMRANYPEKSIEWMKDAHWIGPVEVDPSRVDTADEESWAAWHQGDAVDRFAREIKAGTGHTNPIVMVQQPEDHRAQIVDGHHRFLAYVKLKRRPVAYIGMIRQDDDRWEETHSSQRHQGSDPQNA